MLDALLRVSTITKRLAAMNPDLLSIALSLKAKLRMWFSALEILYLWSGAQVSDDLAA
jgi:hypothetical protein